VAIDVAGLDAILTRPSPLAVGSSDRRSIAAGLP